MGSRSLWNASSICRKNPWRRRVVLALMLLCALHTSWALDGHLTADHYISLQWSVNQIADGAPITALAQTPDGYLWIGTWKGLYRFDGFTFERMRDMDIGIPSVASVLGLVVDAQGSLWIRSQSPRLLRFRNGKFENISRGLENIKGITAMASAAGGAVLVSTLSRGTLEIVNEQVIPVEPGHIGLVLSMTQTRDERIWLGTRENGLFSIVNGQAQAFEEPLADKKVNCLLPTVSGGLWIGTDNGLALWDGKHLVPGAIPSALQHAQVFSLLLDRDNNLWVASEQGIFRLNASGAMPIPGDAAEPGSAATAFFEDRERDLWIGDAQGLTRLRDGTFTSFNMDSISALSRENAIFTDAASRMWVAPSSGGLYSMRDGKTTRVTIPGLDQDVVYAIGGGDDLWLGRQRGGLTHLRENGSTWETQTFTQEDGLAQNNIYAVRQVSDGSIWIGTLTGGVSHLSHGAFSTFRVEDGLAANAISAIEEDRDHALWFGTSNGLSSFLHGQWRIYRVADGLPSTEVTCLTLDHDGILWIGTEGGLAAMLRGNIRPPPSQSAFLHEPIRGMAEGVDGRLWLTTARHVFSLDREAYISGRWTSSDLRVFDSDDGLLATEGVRRSRSVVRDDRGFLWFSLSRGLAYVDPSRTKLPELPSITRVTSILVDGQPISMDGPLNVSAAHQRVAFTYTGISLATPDRVRYRYRLVGFDRKWSAPVSGREATYTNLPPGAYTFEVQSSNLMEIWTGSLIQLAFKVQPMLWQTWPFRLACLSVSLFCVVALYRLRLRYLLNQANLRFEERLAERTLIARELHDTLLQGICSASLQLSVAADQVNEESTAKPHLLRILRLLDQVMEEARGALRGLRSGTPSDSSLEQVFSRLPMNFSGMPEVKYSLLVRGVPRPLQSAIYDEACRVGLEALSNAYRHARATKIEVTVRYGAEQLGIKIHDNGVGIDPRFLHEGRPGHWGLVGMHERAKQAGARLYLASAPTKGTQVLLLIPAHIAYSGQQHHSRISRWLRRIAPRHERAGDSPKT